MQNELINRVINHLFYRIDLYDDMRICGQSLSEYIPSLYRDDTNGIGMTGSESTRYRVLKKIFSDVEIKERRNDSLSV